MMQFRRDTLDGKRIVAQVAQLKTQRLHLLLIRSARGFDGVSSILSGNNIRCETPFLPLSGKKPFKEMRRWERC
jgi:hypothetical protein